jgi:hypothetical protein
VADPLPRWPGRLAASLDLWFRVGLTTPPRQPLVVGWLGELTSYTLAFTDSSATIT